MTASMPLSTCPPLPGRTLFVVVCCLPGSLSRTVGEVSLVIVGAMLSLILRRAEPPARHMKPRPLRGHGGVAGVGFDGRAHRIGRPGFASNRRIANLVAHDHSPGNRLLPDLRLSGAIRRRGHGCLTRGPTHVR